MMAIELTPSPNACNGWRNDYNNEGLLLPRKAHCHELGCIRILDFFGASLGYFFGDAHGASLGLAITSGISVALSYVR